MDEVGFMVSETRQGFRVVQIGGWNRSSLAASALNFTQLLGCNSLSFQDPFLHIWLVE